MRQVIKESQLTSIIRNIIRESLEEYDFGDPNLYEKKKNSAESGKKQDADKDRLNKKLDKHVRKRTREVLSFFKKRSKDGTLINKAAPYAYSLWPGKKKSDARSQFSKCLWGKLNDDGYPYSFTEGEISHLYTMITSAAPSMNESINEAPAYYGTLSGEDLFLASINDRDFSSKYIMPLVKTLGNKPDVSFDILCRSKCMSGIAKAAIDNYQRLTGDWNASISTEERNYFKKKLSEYIINKVDDDKQFQK